MSQGTGYAAFNDYFRPNEWILLCAQIAVECTGCVTF